MGAFVKQLGLIGCGLMGGSFALAMKQAGLVSRVVGYSKSPSSSARALQLGIIDHAHASAEEAAVGCDLVLIAVPVASTESTLRSLSQVLTSNALVMDVGSTKQDVLQAARQALGTSFEFFVPAHPIAGKELAGIEHADASLYRGRQVILTPDADTSPAQLEKARAVWAALGCRVVEMSATDHDAAFATVSHLPHLLAFAYMNGVRSQDDGDRYLALAGTGFRDFSRIAASEPTMWRDILMANREELHKQTQLFRLQLDRLDAAMAQGDGQALQELIRLASDARAKWQLP